MRKLIVLIACLVAPIAYAAPPYDLTLTFPAPTTGGTADGFNAYLDDCVVAGPAAAPLAANYVSGTKLDAVIPSDGTYEACVRGFNSGGEQPDPGVVVTFTVPEELPGPIDSLDIAVTCRDTAGAVVACPFTVTIS